MAALRCFTGALRLLLLLGSTTSAQQETTMPEEPQTMNEERTMPQEPQTMNEETTTSVEFQILADQMGDFTMTNPPHVNGEKLYEADILLTPHQKQLLADRKAINSELYRWPVGQNGNPEVPFLFADGEVDQAAVQAGIDHWEEHTCIRFVDVADTDEPHLEFIKGSGCYSYVGMIYIWGGQVISIGNGCTGVGTVAHEIGHAMGFFHEQSRSDRDDYIHVLSDNILDGRELNFRLKNDNTYGVAYDYSSNLHYGSRYFTNNGNLTIVTKDPMAQEIIGSRQGLSHRDKKLANLMYSCIDKWLAACSLEIDPCQNDGYIGADCNCVCPPGTEGVNCSSVTGGYYDAHLSDCTEEITVKGTITSPNYPSNYPTGKKCNKVIRAPTDCDYTISLTFNDFEMHPMAPYCSGQTCCYFDYLQIRTDDTFEGPVYCDTMISAGDVFTSTTGELVLFFESSAYSHRGWSADVEFIPFPSCTVNTEDSCSVDNIANDSVRWMSPNFGNGDYPNDFICDFQSSSLEPRWARVTIDAFDVEEHFDSVFLTEPFNMEGIELDGDSAPGEIMLPTFNFNGTFETDSSFTYSGFDITFTPETSNCHRLIQTCDIGSTGHIFPPRENNNVWKNKACEWWIESPENTRIKLMFRRINLSCDCDVSSIIVNPLGDKFYPEWSSVQVCGGPQPPPIISSGNKMNILFYSASPNLDFNLKWRVLS